MTTGRLALLMAIGALLAASCASAQLTPDSPDTAGSTDAPTTTSISEPTASTSSTTTTVPTVGSTMEQSDPTSTSGSPSKTDPALAPLVTVAISDLASHLGISESAIVPLSASSVVWPDGALGCPMPGMAYTQVQVDGYLIELTANGQTYSYHGGAGRGPFLCLNPAN